MISKSDKKSLAFLLAVFCSVGLYNCTTSAPKQQEVAYDDDLAKRVEAREADFMQRRAEYIKEHGHNPQMNHPLKQSSVLIQNSHTESSF